MDWNIKIRLAITGQQIFNQRYGTQQLVSNNELHALFSRSNHKNRLAIIDRKNSIGW
jgi:hypothetical protein